MGENGDRRPSRPAIELLTAPASGTEAAAIVAAVERFRAENRPPSRGSTIPQSAWQRAALEEGISRSAGLAPRSDTG